MWDDESVTQCWLGALKNICLPRKERDLQYMGQGLVGLLRTCHPSSWAPLSSRKRESLSLSQRECFARSLTLEELLFAHSYKMGREKPLENLYLPISQLHCIQHTWKHTQFLESHSSTFLLLLFLPTPEILIDWLLEGLILGLPALDDEWENRWASGGGYLTSQAIVRSSYITPIERARKTPLNTLRTTNVDGFHLS